MNKQLTIISSGYHHIPDAGTTPDLDNMTLRQATTRLRQLGRSNFGALGGMQAMLSDCSALAVELQPTSDDGRLQSSQRIIRYAGGYGAGKQTLKW